MPTQKKFFVLSKHLEAGSFGDEEPVCIVTADSPEEVAQLLGGYYRAFTDNWGNIFLPKAVFTDQMEHGYLGYNRGHLHFCIGKDEEGVDLTLDELPIMGKCAWYHLGERHGLNRDCCEIGTLVDTMPNMLCPDAYRLLVDDNYKEDKKNK